ncbi:MULTISPECIES: GNAT family N-acetyltransferase [Nostocales]|uniref:GNAT family N-acetyltransferase n=1 Tax=Nostocales TaxID=1161 RepID=UPI00168267AC|nr:MULTISPECIES: GNAT family N-acetyltransferase [Nostocales]MBD2302795.1 GNAT family N-acetyltransferase [Nostoc sp. FACHB-190]MBD2492173.1 GNAT family N-acetyltransferase [Aulosira sp. FACHB-615]
MLIRSAKPNDVPAILPMVAKICALHESWDNAKYGFVAHIEQHYEKWLMRMAQNERSVFLVAEDDRQLVAFLISAIEQEIPIYRLQEYAFIYDLWVEPEHRQKGIARQMIMLCVERFEQMGIKQIRLDTAVENENARKLFASCGFRFSNIEMLREI